MLHFHLLAFVAGVFVDGLAFEFRRQARRWIWLLFR